MNFNLWFVYITVGLFLAMFLTAVIQVEIELYKKRKKKK